MGPNLKLSHTAGTVRYLTSSTGATTTSYTYDSYGKQLSGSTTASNYTYQNEQKDPESGYTFLRARYYDPTVGRFNSADPLSGDRSVLSTQNGYNYADANPVNMADPSGQNTLLVGAALGGITGGLVSGITYAVTTPGLNWTNASTWQNLGANVAGGALGGAITGGCMGGAAALLGSAVCGGGAGFAASYVTQALDTTPGIDTKQALTAGAQGAIAGGIGSKIQNGVSALSINPGWLSLANKVNGGYSFANVNPFTTTGSLGQKFQLNNALGAGLGWGTGVLFNGGNAKNCSW